jgi:hypothetical protein
MGSSNSGMTGPAEFVGLVMPRNLQIDRVRSGGVRIAGRA